MNFPITRMRRYRQDENLRELFKETKVSVSDFIYPVFVNDNLKTGQVEEISSMPGENRYSIDGVVERAISLEDRGLKSIIIFGIPKNKDSLAKSAYSKEGIVQRTIKRMKEETNLVVMSDVCLCQYTSHGHCGVINEGNVLNDESLDLLAKVALSHAEAGVDVVAPSDMMDGRVGAIRDKLDLEGYENTIIMSYSAKYASAFYAPFREAADSAPSFGNRKTYQMDYHNSNEAIREAELDVFEGADVIMVKPALPYLDIIKSLKDNFNLPVAAYNVSGEYSMIKSAISAGYLTEDAIYESLISIKRAGADLIISHFVDEFLNFK